MEEGTNWLKMAYVLNVLTGGPTAGGIALLQDCDVTSVRAMITTSLFM